MLRRDDKVCKYAYGLNLVIFFGKILPLSMKAKIPFMIAIIQNIRRMSSAESLLSKKIKCTRLTN